MVRGIAGFIREGRDFMKKLKNLSERQIKSYLADQLDEQEKADIDHFLAENPFEADAIEGLKMLGQEERERDLAILQQQLPHYQKPFFQIGWAGMAASVAFLIATIVLAVWILKNPAIDNPVALKNTPQQENTQKTQQTEKKSEESLKPTEENIQDKNLKNQNEKTEEKVVKAQKNDAGSQKEDSFGENSYQAEVTKQPEAEKMVETQKPIVTNTEKDEAGKKELETKAEMENLPKNEVLTNKSSVPTEKFDAQKAIRTESMEEIKGNSGVRNRKQSSKKLKVADKEQKSVAYNKDQANTYEFSGQVLDERTQKALAGVEIEVKNQQIQIRTDSLGNYFLRSNQNHNILLLNKNGYEKREISIQPNERKIIYLKPKF